MYCPFEENLGCPYVDTAVMDKTTTCQECEHYGSGVRPTGATPILGWIVDKLRGHKPTKEEKEMEDHNNFMMGL